MKHKLLAMSFLFYLGWARSIVLEALEVPRLFRGELDHTLLDPLELLSLRPSLAPALAFAQRTRLLTRLLEAAASAGVVAELPVVVLEVAVHASVVAARALSPTRGVRCLERRRRVRGDAGDGILSQSRRSTCSLRERKGEKRGGCGRRGGGGDMS